MGSLKAPQLELVNTQPVSMSGSPTPFAHCSLDALSRITPQRRRHQRLAVTPLGRFLRANKQEYAGRLMRACLAQGVVRACKVRDVSISGASKKTPARPAIGTEVRLGKLRARDAPSGARLRRAIHPHSEPGRAAPIFQLKQ
jgi:hypothetical protein